MLRVEQISFFLFSQTRRKIEEYQLNIKSRALEKARVFKQAKAIISGDL